MVLPVMDGTVVLSDVQLELQELVKSIGKKHGREYWLDCVNNGRYPEKIWQALADTGILGIGVPTEYGGSGGGLHEILTVSESMAALGMRMSSYQHTNFIRSAIVRHGSDQQKDMILPASVEGRVKISLCVTEANSGSNTFRIRTLATPQSDGTYLLNGEKLFIGGAALATHLLVVARTKPASATSDKRDGMAAFLIDRNLPGISVSPPMDIVIPDAVGRHFVTFQDVRIPADCLLGSPEDGVEPAFSGLNAERVLVAAASVGSGYLCIDKTVSYVKQRAVFKDPIGSYQGVQHPLARAKARLDAARLMIYDAARRIVAGERTGRYANMSKLLASEAAHDAADAAVQFHGGYAFDRSTGIWDIFSYIRLHRVAPLNNEMVLNYIAERVLGLPKSYEV